MGSEIRKPVRVLHVLRPAAGGMRHHVLQLATGLAERGFDAEIACPGDADIVQPALAAGIEVRPVPIVGPISPLRDIDTALALADIIRKGRFDIVHAHGSKAGLVGRAGAILGGCPNRIVTVHNDVLEGSVRPRMRKVVIRVERWLAPHTSRVIAVSDALAASLTGAFGLDPALVVTVHNGLDLTPYLAPVDPAPLRERYGIPKDAIVCGQAARFAPQKGHDALLAAAATVLERIDRAWFLLAGDGPLLEPSRRQAQRMPGGERIVFPGYETDVRGMLGALDVFVSSPSSEGLGNAAIEAMAAGLPVVSTRVGGIPEVVEDGVTGTLAGPADAAGLATAMIALARDPGLRVAMGEAGRKRALAEFSEERMLDRTAEIYREVLCSRS